VNASKPARGNTLPSDALVVVGFTGDLARKKLPVIGVASTKMAGDGGWRNPARDTAPTRRAA
jgi:hypothetical protein